MLIQHVSDILDIFIFTGSSTHAYTRGSFAHQLSKELDNIRNQRNKLGKYVYVVVFILSRCLSRCLSFELFFFKLLLFLFPWFYSLNDMHHFSSFSVLHLAPSVALTFTQFCLFCWKSSFLFLSFVSDVLCKLGLLSLLFLLVLQLYYIMFRGQIDLGVRPWIAMEIYATDVSLAFYILLTGSRFLFICLNFLIWTWTRTAW